MKKRVLIIAIILTILLTVISACGNDSFQVEYVGTANVLSTNMFIHGEINKKSMNISLKEAFKDCKVVSFAFAEGENVTLAGTEEGNLYYVGGIIVVLEDESGNSFEVTIKEGSTFEYEKDKDTVRLLPPR